MKSELKKYKIYLIVLGVFVIISFVLGYLYYRDTLVFVKDIDEIYEVVTNGSEEKKQEVIGQFNEGVEQTSEKYDVNKLKESLDRFKEKDIYKLLNEGKDPQVISLYATQYLSIFHGFMIIVVLLSYLEKKFLKGLTTALRIVLNIVILIFVYPYSMYISVIGSIFLPIAIVYCLYKLFKGKKEQTKENVPNEDVVEVEGKVDADEALNNKNTK